MTQCGQCGADVAETAQFCPGCGLRLAPAAEAEAAEPAPATRWRRGRRVVLTFLGVVAVIGLIFVVGMVYFIRHTTIVTSTKNGERVESPFGVVTTNNDPAKLAKSLGVALYPGAVGEKGAQADMPSSVMVSLTFRTPDPPRAIIGFYHVRYPDATVKAQGKVLSLVQVGLRDTMTIKATPQPGHTEIEISDIRR